MYFLIIANCLEIKIDYLFRVRNGYNILLGKIKRYS